MSDRPTRRQWIREAGALAGGLWLAERVGAAEEGAQVGDRTQWPMSDAHRAALAAADESVAAGAREIGEDPWRPAYHFLPASRMLGDPNGLVQLEDGYHAFFQHFPYFGPEGAPMAPGWGHARSKDLVHWERLPIALMPEPDTYDAAAIASGCCVRTDDGPTIVYTSVPPQAQSLARSFDGGLTWAKCARNPLVGRPETIPGLLDGFRDPWVWREGDRWLMLVGSGIDVVGGTVLLYSSPDLLSWELIGPMDEGLGPDCFQWECPAFFRLGEHWILIVSPLYHSSPGLRVPVIYAVGAFDGWRFAHGPWRQLDLAGPEVFYAPNTLLDDRGRRILFGFLLGGGKPGAPWFGMFTLPRELTLAEDGTLLQQPVAEVASLRAERLTDRGPVALGPGETLALGRGRALDLVLDLAPGAEGCLRVEVLAGEADEGALALELDFAAGAVRLGAARGPLPERLRAGGEVRLLVDRSAVEAYVAGVPVSARCTPPPEHDRARLRAVGGAVGLRSAGAWAMESIW